MVDDQTIVRRCGMSRLSFIWGLKMKAIFGSAIAAVALTGSGGVALSADLPFRTYAKAPVMPEVAATWTDFYVGGNVGGGWGQTTGTLTAATPDFALAIAAGTVPPNLGLRSSGAVGGGQVGYNWQAGTLLYGVEGDLQGSGVRSRATLISIGGVVPQSVISNAADSLDWFGTVRARIGVLAQPNWFLYATGGVAFGQTRDGDQSTNPALPAAGNFVGNLSQTRTGWTLGGGTEWMFARQWSVKAEYLYMDLGRSTVMLRDIFGLFPASSLTYQFSHHYSIARVGIDYHFGGPVVAKY